jgi:hypothetical protein
MTIFSDAAGFKYMGDCQWGTLNIDYPTQEYLKAHPHDSISAELTDLCTDSGLSFRNVLAQSAFNSLSSSSTLLWFGSTGDINDRYLFYVSSWNGNVPASGVHVYNDSGSPQVITGVPVTTNRLYYLSNAVNGSNNLDLTILQPSGTVSPVQWAGSSDGSYLALCFFQRNFGTNVSRTNFYYAGLLDDVNTGFSYYNANNNTKSISFTSFSILSNAVAGGHYIVSAGKNLLQSGDAVYPIVCSDGQTPTSKWGTDFLVYDNNATLGYPGIGSVRGMLLGTGSYTLGKPEKIAGSVFPDGGSPWYLPVGTYAGKTLLMRCHSSMA